jgi:hypothetical protein
LQKKRRKKNGSQGAFFRAFERFSVPFFPHFFAPVLLEIRRFWRWGKKIGLDRCVFALFWGCPFFFLYFSPQKKKKKKKKKKKRRRGMHEKKKKKPLQNNQSIASIGNH